ncbi:MAG TPA: hypothetical protein DCL74_06275 [Succinivibrionaceae bacterium]|nr:hypothetical protein [Succinivibrionaceae bacterium]
MIILTEPLYQYDIDRDVIVTDSSVAKVCFTRNIDKVSFAVTPNRTEDIITARIPNFLLSHYGDLIVYERVIDGDVEQTISATSFPILRSKKPLDYVGEMLAPTEYEELDSRVIALENKIGNTEVSSVKTLSVDTISPLQNQGNFCELMFADNVDLHNDDKTSMNIVDELFLLYKQNKEIYMLSLSTGDLYSNITTIDDKIYYKAVRDGWIRSE